MKLILRLYLCPVCNIFVFFCFMYFDMDVCMYWLLNICICTDVDLISRCWNVQIYILVCGVYHLYINELGEEAPMSQHIRNATDYDSMFVFQLLACKRVPGYSICWTLLVLPIGTFFQMRSLWRTWNRDLILPLKHSKGNRGNKRYCHQLCFILLVG